MKATGIVRRIDDLGRVVIPKEIRRTMRMREGDPLEIFTNQSGELIFKKYSPISEITENAGEVAAALYEETGLSVLICDRDDCIAVSGISKSQISGRKISEDLEKIIESRQPSAPENDIYALEASEIKILFAVPVIAAGDIVGAVILIKKDGEKLLTETDERLAKMAAKILGGKTVI